MASVNGFYALRVAKWILALLSLLCIVFVISFLGPYLGFGETRPLTSSLSRLLLVSLVLLWFAGLLFRIPVIFMVFITAGITIWIFGPFLRIGDKFPLSAVNVRIIIFSLLVFSAFLYGVWRLMQSIRLNPARLDNLIKTKESRTEDASVRELRSIIKHAASYYKNKQKSLSGAKIFSSLRPSRDVSPWYIAIGPESSGKTSAILSSGLAFPVPEQLACTGKKTMPTPGCECWFTNEAIFIDTSGKYISNEKKENGEWISMLKEIKKQRSKKSVNGVIIVLSAAELINPDKTALYDLSSRLRARIEEIKNIFNLNFPVYLCITQMDRLSGFSAYFRTLAPEAREQIWGFTLPYAQDNKEAAFDLKASVETELTLLEERIERGITLRMQEEYNTYERKELYSLPLDFRVLAAGVAEVACHVFFISKYDVTQTFTQLRGIYFMSTMQPGTNLLINQDTLVQKWKNYISDISSSAVTEKAINTGVRQVFNDSVCHRHYFLKQFFTDLLLKDAQLACLSTGLTLCYRLRSLACHALCMGMVTWLLYGLYHSYIHNNAYLDSVNKRTEIIKHEVGTLVNATRERILPDLLRLSYQLPLSERFDIHHPPLAYRYGLYMGDAVYNAAGKLHAFFLRRLFLPAIEEQAEVILQKAINSSNREEIYHQLKTYLMVFGKGKIDQAWLAASLFSQWQSTGRVEEYGDNNTFLTFIGTLLSDQEWRKYGRNINSKLVSQARELLQTESPAIRVYKQLKEKILPEIPENVTLHKLTGEQYSGIFTLNDSQIARNGISGLFTREGYHRFFKKYFKELIRHLQNEDSWVTGARQKESVLQIPMPFERSKGNTGANQTLQEAVLKLYLNEYVRHWSEFISSIRLKNDPDSENVSNNLTYDIYALRMMIAPDSPLKNLLINLVRETTLAEYPLSKESKNQERTGELLPKMIQAKNALALSETRVLRENMDNHFSALRELTGQFSPKSTDESAVTSLDSVLAILREYYTFLIVAREAIKNGEVPPVTDKAQQLRIAALSWPEPLDNIILPLLRKTKSKINHQIVNNLGNHARTGIGEACRTVINGKYPFSDSREEVNVRDFEQLFGKGGLMDQYFMAHLADKVDVSVKPWRYKQTSDHGLVDHDILPSFEQAAAIQHFFFQGEDEKKLYIPFTFSIVYMHPDITTVRVKLNESQYKYKHGPVVPVSLVWHSSSDAFIGLSVQPEGSAIKFTGPWALLRWLDSADNYWQTQEGKLHLSFSITTDEKGKVNSGVEKIAGKEQLRLEISGLNNNFLIHKLLRQFRCPAGE